MRPAVATCMKVAAICVALAGFANDARAAGPAASSEAPVKATENGATRRSGFMFGLTFGFGVGSASGTPNNANDLNDSRYYTATGPMFGSQFSLNIMGALADPISVGFFLGGMTFSNSNLQASASGFGLRVDLFPAAMCDCTKPWMKDIGFASRFGIGSVALTPKNDTGLKLADGTQSFISEGIFYDAKVVRMLGGHLSIGPELDYAVSTSIPAEEHGATISLRIVFYGGP
jgi:hypothetical protein